MTIPAAPEPQTDAKAFAAMPEADLVAFAEARLAVLGASPSRVQRMQVVENLEILQGHARATLAAAGEADA
jgi:hypothetical protein